MKVITKMRYVPEMLFALLLQPLTRLPVISPQLTRYENLVRDAATFRTNSLVNALQQASDSITAQAALQGATFPNLTVPMFEVLGEGVMAASGVTFVSYAPLVADYRKYAVYSKAHARSWLDESIEIVLKAPNSPFTKKDFDRNKNIEHIPWLLSPSGEFQDATEYKSGLGLYLPAWQQSPPPVDPGRLNRDLLSVDFSELFLTSKGAKAMVFGEAGPGGRVVGATSKPHEAFFHSQSVFGKDGRNDPRQHPHSWVVTPVFERLNDKSSDVVGFVSALLPWDQFLVGSFAESQERVAKIVLASSCGQQYEYEYREGKVCL